MTDTGDHRETMLRDLRRRGMVSPEVDYLLGLLDEARTAHERRVADLLAANNALLERSRPMTDAAGRIVWTAEEALACALCWSGFSGSTDYRTDTPEQYWAAITERARQTYRERVQELALTEVARERVKVRALIAAALLVLEHPRLWRVLAKPLGRPQPR